MWVSECVCVCVCVYVCMWLKEREVCAGGRRGVVVPADVRYDLS